MGMTIKEIEKECRLVAKKNGLTFKAYKRLKINGSTAYYFENRKTGCEILGNCTISSAYENVCSGYINSLNV